MQRQLIQFLHIGPREVQAAVQNIHDDDHAVCFSVSDVAPRLDAARCSNPGILGRSACVQVSLRYTDTCLEHNIFTATNSQGSLMLDVSPPLAIATGRWLC